MLREIIISIYLIVFNAIFNLFRLFPLQNKTVCVASFGDNIFYTTRTLSNVSDEDIIILTEPSCNYNFDPSIAQILPFQLNKPLTYIKSIYHIATATTILVDNYFGFLAVTKFRAEVTCIQLWHATGALKRFGLQDPSIKNRTPRAIERFQKVYNHFTYIAVGSDKMASIFMQSFGLPNEAMVRTGVPRTDFFYNQKEISQVVSDLKRSIPSINNKKVILYAPTFRDNQLKDFKIQLDIDKLYQAFSNDYIVLVKNHPAVSYVLDHKYEEFFYDVTSYYDVNHILMITDILITDYSSVPCEFSIFERPIIFFAYDLNQYQKVRGLLGDYPHEVPGPIVYTTDEIISCIKNGAFDSEKIGQYSDIWNKYSKGNSCNNLVDFILETKHQKHNII